MDDTTEDVPSELDHPSSNDSKAEGTDNLAQGILQLFQPSVKLIDDKVENVRESQLALREHIDQLTSDLQKLSELQAPPINLEPYVKKLLNCRRRVMLVNGALQNTQERLNKLHQNITREATRKKQLIDNPNLTT